VSEPIETSLGDRRVTVSVSHANRPRDATKAADLITLAASNAAELA
jgi:hypothetical protein